MVLTDLRIKQSKPRDKAYSLTDGGGLYLWVTPTGGKLFRWGYRFDGKRKLMALGKYPDVSLAEAREKHANSRKLLAKGMDPMAQRKSEKSAEKAAVENSFQSIASLWLDHWQDGKSPRHVDSVKRRMELDILPALGSRPISEIEAPEVVAMSKAIQDRGARDIAKRALETTSQVFRTASLTDTANGIQPSNSVHETSSSLPRRPTTRESMQKNCLPFCAQLRFIKAPTSPASRSNSWL